MVGELNDRLFGQCIEHRVEILEQPQVAGTLKEGSLTSRDPLSDKTPHDNRRVGVFGSVPQQYRHGYLLEPETPWTREHRKILDCAATAKPQRFNDCLIEFGLHSGVLHDPLIFGRQTNRQSAQQESFLAVYRAPHQGGRHSREHRHPTDQAEVHAVKGAESAPHFRFCLRTHATHQRGGDHTIRWPLCRCRSVRSTARKTDHKKPIDTKEVGEFGNIDRRADDGPAGFRI